MLRGLSYLTRELSQTLVKVTQGVPNQVRTKQPKEGVIIIDRLLEQEVAGRTWIIFQTIQSTRQLSLSPSPHHQTLLLDISKPKINQVVIRNRKLSG